MVRHRASRAPLVVQRGHRREGRAACRADTRPEPRHPRRTRRARNAEHDPASGDRPSPLSAEVTPLQPAGPFPEPEPLMSGTAAPHAGGYDFPPLHAAWLMARSARDAAAAWTLPCPPEDVPELADHLQSAFRSLSHALLSLACCIDCTPPQERDPHSFEVSQHVYRAPMVIDQAGAGLLRDLPLHREPRTGSAAAETGYELARRISCAYLSMGNAVQYHARRQDRGDRGVPARHSQPRRRYRHAGIAVAEPAARRFTAAQARLAEADEHLLSALERSAARPEQSGRLTLAQRARDRYPLNHHPRRRPDTGDHPARLAMASFPASPAGLAGQPTGEPAASPAPWPRLKHRLTRSPRSTP